jgi:hypothetical protein
VLFAGGIMALYYGGVALAAGIYSMYPLKFLRVQTFQSNFWDLILDFEI